MPLIGPACSAFVIAPVPRLATNWSNATVARLRKSSVTKAWSYRSIANPLSLVWPRQADAPNPQLMSVNTTQARVMRSRTVIAPPQGAFHRAGTGWATAA